MKSGQICYTRLHFLTQTAIVPTVRTVIFLSDPFFLLGELSQTKFATTSIHPCWIQNIMKPTSRVICWPINGINQLETRLICTTVPVRRIRGEIGLMVLGKNSLLPHRTYMKWKHKICSNESDPCLWCTEAQFTAQLPLVWGGFCPLAAACGTSLCRVEGLLKLW